VRRNIGLAIALIIFCACSTDGSIISTPSSDVLVLSPTYSVLENRGKTPIQIESRENLARFQLNRAGQPPEFLLVLYPEKVSGEIILKLKDQAKGVVSGNQNRYFDQLLRSHRLLLRGDLARAKEIIRRTEDRYGSGYGTLVLLANIAIIEGNNQEAASFLERSKLLVPNSAGLNGLAGETVSGGEQ